MASPWGSFTKGYFDTLMIRNINFVPQKIFSVDSVDVKYLVDGLGNFINEDTLGLSFLSIRRRCEFMPSVPHRAGLRVSRLVDFSRKPWSQL